MFGLFDRAYRLPVSNRISRISRISPMIPPPQYMATSSSKELRSRGVFALRVPTWSGPVAWPFSALNLKQTVSRYDRGWRR